MSERAGCALLLLASACVIVPDLEGRPCGERGCVDGFVCVDDRCIDEGTVPASDAGTEGGATTCEGGDLDVEGDCVCPPGFLLEDDQCEDIDECVDATRCAPDATCDNTPGAFTCTCPDGFTGDGLRECVPPPCASDDECDEGLCIALQEEVGECPAPVGCGSLNRLDEGPEVCGCDGQSYPTSEAAYRARVGVAAIGPCP